jgi:HEAT repeat protein
MSSRFRAAMRLVRRHDPQLREEGFMLLRDHAADHLDDLMAAFQQEDDDHGLRCWLLELIGQAQSERTFPLLAGQLRNDDESLRSWAVKGLKDLDSPAARQACTRRERTVRSSDSPSRRTPR